MKRRFFFTLLTAALARAQNQAQQPKQAPQQVTANPPGYTIAGLVVNFATNAPLAKVVVQIASTINRGEKKEVVTGPDGRFLFSNLPAYKFALTVTRQSGAPQSYLADGNFGTAIVTGPDQDTSHIVFPFHQSGTLSGTILDEASEAVPNANVHLFSQRIDESGIRRLTPAETTATRSSGQFRFSHLTPGNYIAGVSAQPWFAQYGTAQYGVAQNGSGQDVGGNDDGFSFYAPGRRNSPSLVKPNPQFDVAYPFTYYPSALDPAAATLLPITEGGQPTIQINLRSVPSIHVRLAGGDSKPGAGMNIQASAIGPEGSPIPLNHAAAVQGGQGELSGLAPGRYQLSITSYSVPAGGGRAGESEEGRAMRSSFSRKVVDLVDGSMVDLSAASRIAVKATVTVAGNDQPGNRIALLLHDPRTGAGINAIAGADGTVRFPEANFTPGRYEISVPNTPLFRVLSVEAKGAKMSGGTLLIEDNADVQLSVVIGRRSSINIDGFATRDNQAVMGAMVLLLPKARAVGMTVYRDQSDSDGSFVFHNVSAGSYLAIAIDNGRDLAFGDPGVIKSYLAGAHAVTVKESAGPSPLNVPVQLRVPQIG